MRGGRRQSVAALAVLLSCLVFISACSTPRPDRAEVQPAFSGAPHSATAPSTGSKTLPASEPIRVEIPAIGVRAPVGRVGLNPDGTVEVPSLDRAADTGWYEYGPTPGEIGPAVLLGHVDAKKKPAVFFRLKQLKAGDTIHVLRADGSTALFRTTSVEEFPKTQFPTERVYGDLDHPALRLITCGGAFDADRGSYTDNVVAFATFTGLA